MNQNNYTDVDIMTTFEKTYTRKSLLGGLISWWVKKSAQKLGDDLVINSAQTFDKIYFNGIEYTAKPKP